MIYGYSIIEKKVIGHGAFYWDEYYETTEYRSIKTKLFNSPEERDKSKEEDEKKYSMEIRDETLIIVPFDSDFLI